MRRFALVPVIALLALACQDQRLPTDSADELSSSPAAVSSVETASAEEIEALIEALFPEPGLETAALTQFGNVERELEEGNLEEARSKAVDLIGFTLEKLDAGQLEAPPDATTEEGVSELIGLLLTFVGLEPPEVSPSVLSGDTDGVVAIASPDEDNLIVTENEFAGTFIEAGDLDEETVVVIERLDPTAQPEGDCLPVGTDQREGCYRFDKSPDEPFEDEVLVAVCPEEGIRDETDPDFEEFQLAKFDPANPELGVVGLPSASEDFLDCSGFGTLASAGEGALGALAARGWRATGGRLLRWLGPAPARAVNLGFGGSTTDFSRIGWARLLDAEIVTGNAQADFVGFPVDTNPTVRVRPAHPPSSTDVLEGVDVTFSVTGGGGSVDDPGTPAVEERLGNVTVTTDAGGLASVPWRLGSAGGNGLEAEVAGDAVTFSATASAPQLPIQCSGDGTGDRVLNTGNVGRAFYVPGYPDSDLARVDLWISADTTPPSPIAYTIELTARDGGFGGSVLGTAVTTVQLSGGENSFTQATFGFQIADITPGSTVAFRPEVTDAPDVEVFMEVPTSDPDPQFPFDGDAGCPIIETGDASAPLGTDRRQGVRATISAGD